MNQDDVVIVAAARTPQGRLKGQLAPLTAVELGSIAIKGALEQGGISADAVDAVLVGQVLPAGAGQNPARQAAIGAGIGWDVHAGSINKVCLSGLTAIIDGARMLKVGDATVVVAAGMESMTRSPHLLVGSRDGWAYGSIEVLDHMAYDGLTDAFDRESMGASTERHNGRLEITREAQDAVAARSHQRAAAAQDERRLRRRDRPGRDPAAEGRPRRRDEGRGHPSGDDRRDARGPATGLRGGRIDHGGQLVADLGRRFRRRPHDPRRTPMRTAGPCSPSSAQPARSPAPTTRCTRSRRARSRRPAPSRASRPHDLDIVEINEAFAAVVARSQAELGLSDDVVNIHGGGIAIGHPIGASGNRLVVHAVHELVRRGSGTAAVALCGGGGQGDALILTR